MSLAAGLAYAGFTFIFGRFLSMTSLLFLFALAVLFGAVLVRLGGKVIGGFIVAGFAFLWWYFGMAGPYVTFGGLMINLRSPLGIICSGALVLGLAAGALDVAEAVFLGSRLRN